MNAVQRVAGLAIFGVVFACHATRTGVSMLEYRYDSPFPFTGTIDKLTIDIAPPPSQSATARPSVPDLAVTLAVARD